jgi:bifunctional non-homologous end joining protein LigD
VPPPRIAPLRPARSKTVPVGREWIYELKLDGFRGVLTIDDGRGRFTSKNEKPLKRFDDLANAIARTMPVKSAIFDGEIIVMGESGPDFYALFFRRGVPAYAAFDILWLDGRDLRTQPLWRRKKTLARIVKNSPIGLVDHVDDPALYAVTAARDLEGIVAKRRNDAYDQTARWVKVKHPGYSQMEGRWELFDRR